RPGGGADPRRRPLGAAGAAGAEREDRRQGLDPDDPPPHHAPVVVEGVDHRVASAAAGLGREPAGEAAEERADRGDDYEEPGAEVGGRLAAGELLAVGAERHVAGEALEREALQVLERGEEAGADEAGADAGQAGVEERPPEDVQLERRAEREEAKEPYGDRLPRRGPGVAVVGLEARLDRSQDPGLVVVLGSVVVRHERGQAPVISTSFMTVRQFLTVLVVPSRESK